MSVREFADYLAQHQVSVIPLDHPDAPRAVNPEQVGKTPTLKWKAYQTTRATTTELDQWFGNGPTNLGIVTGAISGLVMVDTDSADAEAWVQAQLPDTPLKVQTGKGFHRYYRHPGGTIPNKARIRAGVDVRGDGGYAVAPESLHRSGQRYRCVDRWPASWDEVPRFDPAWLPAESPNLKRMRAYLKRTPAAIEGEGGDAHTFQVCCRIVRGFNATDAEARTVLREWNQGCQPVWSDAELDAKIHNARVYGTEAIGSALSGDTTSLVSTFTAVDEDTYTLNVGAFTYEATHLYTDRNHLHAELVVRVPTPTSHTVGTAVQWAVVDLSSVTARRAYAQSVQTHAQTQQDLERDLTELVMRIFEQRRQGSGGVVDLLAPGETASEDSTRWIVAGVPLARQHPTIVFGDGGTLKSYLVLHLALGLVAQGVRVLFADWELSEHEHRARARRLGLTSGDGSLTYVRCEWPLVEECERLRTIARTRACQYLICDSIAPACGGKPEASETATAYMRAVRRIGLGSLHVAHTSKAEGGDQKPFGSVFWHNLARTTYYTKAEESDGRATRVGWFPRKHNLGAMPEPMGFAVEFLSDNTRILPFNFSDMPELSELSEALPLWRRIATDIKHYGDNDLVRVYDIRDRLGCSLDSIQKAIRRKARTVFLTTGAGKQQVVSLVRDSEARTCPRT